jgi:hypothetical protein
MNDSLSCRIERIFPFKHLEFDKGLKYLGFNLKPNNYGKEDWRWFLSKIEQRITFWCNRWISRGGRLFLIKSILEAIPVFWHTLAHIPKRILEKIRKVCFNYLWKGKSFKALIARWKLISISKETWGWGLKDIHLFGRSLATKSLWRS